MKLFYKKYHYPLLMLALLLLFGGLLDFNQEKTGLFPDITFPKIKIIADAGQQPVDKMMTTVTVPLENAIRRTEGLDYIRSTTSRGSCEISVFFKWSTDIDLAKQRLESLISEIQNDLPLHPTITVQKMNPSILPVMGFSLEGNRSQVELRKIAQYQIKPFLASAEGVSDVQIIGGKTKEYQIVLQPEKINSLGITLQMIQNAVTQSNVLQSNGYIRDHGRLYLTLTDNSIDNIKKLQSLVISNSSNRLVTLGDISDIKITEAKEFVKINANGKDVPLIAILKQPESNLIDVSSGIQDRVKELETILPPDIKLIPYYNQADFVDGSIKSLRDVLLLGLILAIIVVFAFLRSSTSSIAILLTIPLTLSLTVIILNLIGYTFNIMTLGALAAAIGLIIDDAVIVVEQIHRSHEENPNESVTFIVTKSIHYLLPSMIGSSLSTMVIFFPFIMMTGVAGAYFKVLAMTMIITLASSFFVTWILLPVIILSLPVKTKLSAVKQHPAIIKLITYFLNRPVISYVLIFLAVAALLFIPAKLATGFLPEMDEGSIVLDFNSPNGTTLEETDRLLSEVDKILKAQPEVEKFSRRIGTQMGFFITEPNRGDYLIQLKTDREKTTEEVSDEIRTEIETTLPQLTIDFGQVIGDMLGDLMSSVQPIEIKVFGDDQEKLESLSQQVSEVVGKVNGTADVFDGIVIAGPEVTIEPNAIKLAQFGMTPSDFQFQLQTQIEGSVISSMIDKEQIVNIRLIYPDAGKTSINSIKNSTLLMSNGIIKPIASFASIQIKPGVSEINRENQKMLGVITARLNNRDLGSTLSEIKSEIESKIKLPSGYHIEFGGLYAEQQRAFKELMIILISASLLVFITMLFLFHNIKVSFVIIGIAILGVSGSLIALFITGTPLNVGSYTGIIMIVGIIGENSIFTFQQYLEARKTMSVDESLTYSIALRLRPKLMTASGAIIALFPLALGIGTGAQLHQPLAISVIGGLIVALPFLLIVFPSVLKQILPSK